MYSSEDFERLFIRYKGEVYLRNESIQSFYHRNNSLITRSRNGTGYKAQGSGSFRSFFTAGNGEDKGNCPVIEGGGGLGGMRIGELVLSNGHQLSQGNLSYADLKHRQRNWRVD